MPRFRGVFDVVRQADDVAPRVGKLHDDT
jgi:hypothetical protein